MSKVKTIALVLAVLFSAQSGADETEELKDKVLQLDNQFFTAFNRCDLDTMAAMFSPDLEFFHDTAGVSDYAQTMQATRNNCARKLGLVRTLVEGSVRVFPIKEYGAIQQGKHRFCHIENGNNDCGVFDFLHIWQRTDQGWQISRVVSYGH